MKTRTIMSVTIFLIMVAVVLAGASQAVADKLVTTDAIAGTWYGHMHFSVDNHVEPIRFMIPAGCEPGDVCGTLYNYPLQCVWEVTYDGFEDFAYQYHFSNTLKGGCSFGTNGSVQLLADGSLYWVHYTLHSSTATGLLNQRPNAAD